MTLEEHTIEQVPDRCEVCGAQLTDEELQVALESGEPALCNVHAAEASPALEADAIAPDEP